MIPPYPKNNKQPCKSLARLGFHPKAAGVSRRPVIPRATETMIIVESYLDIARKGGVLINLWSYALRISLWLS